MKFTILQFTTAEKRNISVVPDNLAGSSHCTVQNSYKVISQILKIQNLGLFFTDFYKLFTFYFTSLTLTHSLFDIT